MHIALLKRRGQATERDGERSLALFLGGAAAMIVAAAGLLFALVFLLDWAVPTSALAAGATLWPAFTPVPEELGARGDDTAAEHERAFASSLARDGVAVLLDRVRRGRFRRHEEVATGRVVAELVATAARLEDVDTGALKIRQRGQGWMLIEAPYVPVGEPEGAARLRFVEEDGSWKLEDVRFVR